MCEEDEPTVDYLDWTLVETIDDALALLARIRERLLAGEPDELAEDAANR